MLVWYRRVVVEIEHEENVGFRILKSVEVNHWRGDPLCN
jgi:hypothetical protein